MAAIVARPGQYVRIGVTSLHVAATCQVSCIDDPGAEWPALGSGLRAPMPLAGHVAATPSHRAQQVDRSRCPARRDAGEGSRVWLGAAEEYARFHVALVRQAPGFDVCGTTCTTVVDWSSTARLRSGGCTEVKSDDLT